jgi:MFS family permease
VADGTWVRDLRVLLAALFLLFANVTLLVPVLPVIADEAAGATGAGAVTAAFFFPAVAAQLRAPLVLHRFRATWVLAGSLALVGLPCALYAWRPDSFVLLLAATAVRGVGFGLATVASGTLVADRAPAVRRGLAVGYAGLAAGIPPVFAPACGVWLLEQSGEQTVFAAAGVLATGAALVSLALTQRPTADAARPRLARALLEPALRRPLLWFGLASVTRGAVISFVPLTLAASGLRSAGTFLLVFGTSAYVSRWASGRLADRVGPRRLVVPSITLALAGLILLALDQASATVVPAAALFGLGLGALMTGSQLVMLAAAHDGRFAVPTAAWNVALDCGFGLGGLLLGIVAAMTGYGAAFWLLPAVMVAALALAHRDGAASRLRPA